VQTTAHDWVPDQDPDWTPEVRAYLSEWHANMSVGLAPSLAPASKNGVFFPACFIHTAFSPSSPLIQGVDYITGFRQWYYKEAGAQTKLQDTCGILCNPTCKN
jgi:hypothetical protein